MLTRAFVFLALVLVSALAQDVAFTVELADKVCRSPADCAYLGNTCCGCSHQAVNQGSLAKYEDLLQNYSSARCTAVLCAAVMCDRPTLTCEGASVKYCGFAPPTAFDVEPQDQACSSARDCTFVGNTCCASSNCDYQPVNITAKPTYDALYATFVSNQCAAVACLARVCDPAPLDCVAGSCQFTTATPNPCPPGVTQVQCFADPCGVSSCAAYPNAECRANYCGGCNAEYFDASGAKVDCNAMPNPFENVPADDTVCAADSDCTAITSSCCGCDMVPISTSVATKYQGLLREFRAEHCIALSCIALACDQPSLSCVSGHCAIARNPCPAGQSEVQCFADPCSTATCAAFPEATCKANYCGGCNAEFFVDDEKVDCTEPSDPCNGLPVVDCFADPCSTATCAADPTATCRPNYCGGCNAEFFDRSGAKVDCTVRPTVAFEVEPADQICTGDDDCNSVPFSCCADANCDFAAVNDASKEKYDALYNAYVSRECIATMCLMRACLMAPLSCVAGRDNVRRCQFGETVNPNPNPNPEPNPCPNLSQRVECFAAPCSTATCAAFPNAVCENDYCGGCSAVFKVDGRVVDCGETPRPTEHTVCPSGVPEVQCFADPCSVNECPSYPNADCTADYCGGCRAIFTVEGRRVNCDAGCSALPCDSCIANPNCKYCSGTYATPNDLSAVQHFGFCVAASTNGDTCTSASGRLLTAGATCPSFPTRPNGDPAHIQDVIDDSTAEVRNRFIIVITLLVNETSLDLNGLHVVKMFVDLIGPGTPEDSDRAEVCEILKEALHKVDARPNPSTLNCLLEEKITSKRDAAYVASLTFPGTSPAMNMDGNSATATLLSVAAAAFAALFNALL